jgi:intraflagellar transport protein 56
LNPQILSRAKSDSAQSTQRSAGAVAAKRRQIPTFEEFLLKRDYVGANTILKYSKDHDETDENIKDLWMAFCNFHLGDYKLCLEQFEKMYEKNKDVKDIALNIGVCMFYLGMYEDAQKMIEDLPESPLKVKLSNFF